MALRKGYHWRELCKDFEKALQSDDNYDVIIKCGNDSSAVDLYAHSFVLRARCPFFKNALTDNWKEKGKDGKYTVLKRNINPTVFQLILRYLYTGFIDYEQLTLDVIMSTLLAADELCLDNLIEHLQNHVIGNDATLLEDPLATLEIIYKNPSFEKLKDCCLQNICSNPTLLFSSERFPLVEEQILKIVLNRDDLEMEEVDVWDSVLRWHFVRYLKNDPNVDSMPPSDFSNMKESIKEFIPLIRLYDISMADFYLKVYPYKDMLPGDLLDDILRYYVVPNSVPKLCLKPARNPSGSILIKRDLFKLFKKWILEDDTMENRSIYKFRLLLRGTRDGFDSEEFHEKCDEQGATLVVAKIKDSPKIVGGYNPLYWSCSGQYLATADSFLFHLNPNDLKSATLGRIYPNYHTYAVYNNVGYGPHIWKWA